MIKSAIIKKLQNGQYRLYSRKKDEGGGRRNLGTFDSLDAAKEREQQVHYFKSNADDGEADDHETKTLSKLSELAQYLEKAGFVDKAKVIYNTMSAIDSALEDHAADFIPDNQRNIDNQGYMGGDGVGGGYSLLHTPMIGQPADDHDFKLANIVKLIKRDYNDGLFNKISPDKMLSLLSKKLNMNINNSFEGGFISGLAVAMEFLHPQEAFGNPEAYQSALVLFENPGLQMDDMLSESAIIVKLVKIANKLDKKELYEEADDIDKLIKQLYMNFLNDEDYADTDVVARSNGLQGNTSIDGGSAGMFQGLSDAYFYQDYTNLDHRYKISP